MALAGNSQVTSTLDGWPQTESPEALSVFSSAFFPPAGLFLFLPLETLLDTLFFADLLPVAGGSRTAILFGAVPSPSTTSLPLSTLFSSTTAILPTPPPSQVTSKVSSCVVHSSFSPAPSPSSWSSQYRTSSPSNVPRFLLAGQSLAQCPFPPHL